MELNVGDIISTEFINAGEFLGYTTESLGGMEMKMGKVYESAKDMTHYIPLKTLETVEKLPSKELFEKCLKKFNKISISDMPEIDPSDRYEYFKTNLEEKDLAVFMKNFKLLLLLDSEKALNIHEKKLLNRLKAKFESDTEIILGWDKKESKSFTKIH